MWWRSASEQRRRRWKRMPRGDRPESVLRFSAHDRVNGKEWGRRMIMAVIVLSSLTACGVLIWVGTQSLGRLLFWQNDLFRVRDIKIECKGDIITPKHIMEYARLSEMKYLFAANIGEIRDQLLLQVPRLKTVEIKRRLPGELIICVRERASMAQLAAGHNYLTLDREGYVLGKAAGSKSMPILVGYDLPGIRPGVQLSAAGVRNALEIVDVCQTTPIGQQVRIASIDVRNAQALELRLADGERVLLAWTHMGEPSSLAHQHLEQKLVRLAESLKSAAHRNRRIAWIDMTLENNFPAQEY
ncbi:MAG: FtsQ-type POTRA domain-containing protein [Kiritimatiellae bacterium]|nr:FtsQ-type POTRA domain-containing protein [Kiritimatiellia bacterium]